MTLDNLSQLLGQTPFTFMGEETAFRSAVLLPLIRLGDEWHVLFEIRSAKLHKQPGDISFPGGRIDPEDPSPLAAAVRETAEELQLACDRIRVLGALPPYVPSASFVIYPFVGVVDYDPTSRSFNRDEVADVFTIPVRWLLAYEPYVHVVPMKPTPGEDFPYDKIVNGREYQWRSRNTQQWFYDYENHTIWGLTARILKHFTDLLRNGAETLL